MAMAEDNSALDLGAEWDTYHEVPAIADAYREVLGEQFVGQLSSATPGYLNDLAERNGWSREHRLLDLGCGTGGLTAALASVTGGSVVGLDASPAAVRVATARRAQSARHRVSYVVGDMSAPGFPPGSFDGILSIGSAYWSDPVPTVENWRRLLRSDSSLVVIVISTILRARTARDAELTLQAGLFEPAPDWAGALDRAGFHVTTRDLTPTDAVLQESLYDALARRLPQLREQMGGQAGERYLAEVEVMRDEHRARRFRRAEICARLDFR